MIWYEVPAYVGMIAFFVLLVAAALQAVVTLEARELVCQKGALRLLRLSYAMRSCICALFALEGIIVIASIEGGVLLSLPTWPRYAAVLPALACLADIRSPLQTPSMLRPLGVSHFIPLLYLPQVGVLSAPLPAVLAVFAAVWLLFDALRMLYIFQAYANNEITRSAMLHVIRDIDSGVCVANRRGWILESNPSFLTLCGKIGIERAETVEEINNALEMLSNAGKLVTIRLKNGLSIWANERAYMLQRSGFSSGGRAFLQLTLSDVTDISRTAAALKHENAALDKGNRELEMIIADIELEEAVRERERLCRTAHDCWSQRLAVAGLSVDMLLSQSQEQPCGTDITEITMMLEAPEQASYAVANDLQTALQSLAKMYSKLGVRVQVGGKAEFTRLQKETLCHVLREALANAVRHAYARDIDVRFFETSLSAGLTIENKCIEQGVVVEGRGLYDMRERVHSAGGLLDYETGDCFRLRVAFLKNSQSKEETA